MSPGESDQSPATDQRLSKRLVKRIADKDETSREFSDMTLYVSIEGQQDFSSFTLETTFGNTCKFVAFYPNCLCTL